jgi:hypothetical protein
MMRLHLVSMFVALPLFAAVAHAQETPVTPPPPNEAAPLPPCPAPPAAEQAPPPYTAETPPPAPQPMHVEHRRHHNIIFAPTTMSLMTGVGPSNYFGTGVNGVSDVGAAWDARVTFGTASLMALETAYVGSVNNVETTTEGIHGQLFGNGIDGDLRLQLPWRAQPYVFGGVGWNHASLRNVNAIGGESNAILTPRTVSDDQFTVPAGAGFTGYLGKHATVDLRGTYRFTPDNSLPIQTDKGQMHQWTAQAHLGYVF